MKRLERFTPRWPVILATLIVVGVGGWLTQAAQAPSRDAPRAICQSPD